MEGAAGITEDEPLEKQIALYTNEIQLILGMLLATPDAQIYLCDVHNGGEYCNRLIEPYGDNITIINKPWDIDFTTCFDMGILTGFHPMNGVVGNYAHSFRYEFSHLIYQYAIHLGELGIFARWLINHGIQIVFISGHQNSFAEVQDIQCKKIATQDTNPDFVFDRSEFASELVNSSRRSKFNLSENIYQGCLSVDFKSDINSYIQKKFSSHIKNDEHGSLLFENIDEFIFSIDEICTLLNARLSRNYNVIKKSVKNVRGKKINFDKTILYKSIIDLSESEINNIIKKCGVKDEDN